MTPLCEKDISWLAGWLEGEGCFYLDKGRPCINVVTTDYDVILRAANLAGVPDTRIKEAKKRLPHHKQQYYLNLRSGLASEIMRTIRPHMGLRRGNKIDEVLLYVKGSPERRKQAITASWVLRDKAQASKQGREEWLKRKQSPDWREHYIEPMSRASRGRAEGA